MTRDRMSASSGVALAVAALFASLSLVMWRQNRALEALADLEYVRREAALVRAEHTTLLQRNEDLQSRMRVVSEARERLGMHAPDASQIVILPGDVR